MSSSRPFIATSQNVVDENECIYSPNILCGQPVLVSRDQNRRISDTVITTISSSQQPNCSCPCNKLPPYLQYGFQNPPATCALQAQKQNIAGTTVFNFSQPQQYGAACPLSSFPSAYTPPPPPNPQFVQSTEKTPQTVCVDFGRFGMEAIAFQKKLRDQYVAFTFDKSIGTTSDPACPKDRFCSCHVEAKPVTMDQKQQFFYEIDLCDSNRSKVLCFHTGADKGVTCFPKPNSDKSQQVKTLVIQGRKESSNDCNIVEEAKRESELERIMCEECLERWRKEKKRAPCYKPSSSEPQKHSSGSVNSPCNNENIIKNENKDEKKKSLETVSTVSQKVGTDSQISVPLQIMKKNVELANEKLQCAYIQQINYLKKLKNQNKLIELKFNESDEAVRKLLTTNIDTEIDSLRQYIVMNRFDDAINSKVYGEDNSESDDEKKSYGQIRVITPRETKKPIDTKYTETKKENTENEFYSTDNKKKNLDTERNVNDQNKISIKKVLSDKVNHLMSLNKPMEDPEYEKMAVDIITTLIKYKKSMRHSKEDQKSNTIKPEQTTVQNLENTDRNVNDTNNNNISVQSRETQTLKPILKNFGETSNTKQKKEIKTDDHKVTEEDIVRSDTKSVKNREIKKGALNDNSSSLVQEANTLKTSVKPEQTIVKNSGKNTDTEEKTEMKSVECQANEGEIDLEKNKDTINDNNKNNSAQAQESNTIRTEQTTVKNLKETKANENNNNSVEAQESYKLKPKQTSVENLKNTKGVVNDGNSNNSIQDEEFNTIKPEQTIKKNSEISERDTKDNDKINDVSNSMNLKDIDKKESSGELKEICNCDNCNHLDIENDTIETSGMICDCCKCVSMNVDEFGNIQLKEHFEDIGTQTNLDEDNEKSRKATEPSNFHECINGRNNLSKMGKILANVYTSSVESVGSVIQYLKGSEDYSYRCPICHHECDETCYKGRIDRHLARLDKPRFCRKNLLDKTFYDVKTNRWYPIHDAEDIARVRLAETPKSF